MTTTQQMLDARYGRTRSRGRMRAFWVIVAIAAIAGFGWIAWSTVHQAATTATADELGFEVLDEGTVSVSFQITAPADREVVCFVEAQDEEHGVVGWKAFRYGPEAGPVQRHTVEIPTVALATSGLVNSCQVL